MRCGENSSEIYSRTKPTEIAVGALPAGNIFDGTVQDALDKINAGADLRAVQDMLGHESITTTEIYTHLDKDFLRSAIIEFHPRGRMK